MYIIINTRDVLTAKCDVFLHQPYVFDPWQGEGVYEGAGRSRPHILPSITTWLQPPYAPARMIMMGPSHAGAPLVWGPGVAGAVMVIRGTDLYYRPDTYLNTSHLPLVGGGRNLGTHPWRAPRTL